MLNESNFFVHIIITLIDNVYDRFVQINTIIINQLFIFIKLVHQNINTAKTLIIINYINIIIIIKKYN